MDYIDDRDETNITVQLVSYMLVHRPNHCETKITVTVTSEIHNMQVIVEIHYQSKLFSH